MSTIKKVAKKYSVLNHTSSDDEDVDFCFLEVLPEEHNDDDLDYNAERMSCDSVRIHKALLPCFPGWLAFWRLRTDRQSCFEGGLPNVSTEKTPFDSRGIYLKRMKNGF